MKPDLNEQLEILLDYIAAIQHLHTERLATTDTTLNAAIQHLQHELNKHTHTHQHDNTIPTPAGMAWASTLNEQLNDHEQRINHLEHTQEQ